MSSSSSSALAQKLQSRDATREPTWVKVTLIVIAMIFFLSCLILPLILVLLLHGVSRNLTFVVKLFSPPLLIHHFQYHL